jgi:hypothetical protein
MGSFWDKLSKNVKTGIEVSQRKIEEYSHIGKLKLDVSFAKRNKGRLARDLGEKVHAILCHENSTEVANNVEVKAFCDKISAAEKLIADLENRLAEAVEKQKQDSQNKPQA